MTVTSTARTILDDTSVGAIRTTLGVGTSDNPQLLLHRTWFVLSDTTISVRVQVLLLLKVLK